MISAFLAVPFPAGSSTPHRCLGARRSPRHDPWRLLPITMSTLKHCLALKKRLSGPGPCSGALVPALRAPQQRQARSSPHAATTPRRSALASRIPQLPPRPSAGPAGPRLLPHRLRRAGDGHPAAAAAAIVEHPADIQQQPPHTPRPGRHLGAAILAPPSWAAILAPPSWPRLSPPRGPPGNGVPLLETGFGGILRRFWCILRHPRPSWGHPGLCHGSVRGEGAVRPEVPLAELPFHREARGETPEGCG